MRSDSLQGFERSNTTAGTGTQLQTVRKKKLRSNDACWNFHHFDIQSTGYLERETRLIPPTVYSRLFEFPLLWQVQGWLP